MNETAVSTVKTTGIGRIALVVTRVLSGGLAALVLFQGAMAGSFLSGNAAALGIHEMMGTEVLTIVALATALAALVGVRQQWWPLAVAIVGAVGIVFQIEAGFGGQLGIHLPLGIGLFGLYLTMALVLKPTKTQDKGSNK
ncbi:MAG: hypothetical protein GEU79_14045 [Acidimicrobiia bacterium]|nr:hypothetical protein [Acidimicrobiia bacterium]